MVSIITINYHVREELFASIQSIIDSKPETAYEIIVIDNDEQNSIKKDLLKKFSKVKYIPNQNKGFGQGNNIAAKHAKGEYLFFLNPDTKIYPHTLDNLISFLKKNKDVAIVAPLLLGVDEKPYQQGALTLTPLRALFALSFINKLFPDNPVSRKYFLAGWDRTSQTEVDVAPGTAFVISKKLFTQIGGFDENFFLFFEEFDLCKRVRELGYKIVIIPDSRVIHFWGKSTKKRNDTQKIYRESRSYYFKKHFGFLTAFFLNIFLSLNKTTLLLAIIILLGFFLRFYLIGQTMHFISEQGWFYLSARDAIVSGKIPLVGMQSSREWLHQGAYWTYLLIPIFWLFGFNPLNGVYISIFLDVLAIYFIYKLGATMFSNRVGLISAILYSTSPFVIFIARMPYHTSPIPLLAILFIYCLYQWVRGVMIFFPLTILSLVFLYNFELATVPFWFIFLLVFAFGIFKRKKWALGLRNQKIITLSILALIIPMLPVLLHDLTHNFNQTFGFTKWIVYKVLVGLGFPSVHPETQTTPFNDFLIYAAQSYRTLIIAEMPFVSFAVFIFSFYFFYSRLIANLIKKIFLPNWIILGLVLTVTLFSFMAIKTPSEAYLPMLFPGIIIMTALFFDTVINKTNPSISAVFIVIIIALSNTIFVVSTISKDYSFAWRMRAAKTIVTRAEGKEYNLKWGGVDKKLENFTQNIEYLTWWLGHGPSRQKQKLEFVISGEKENVKMIQK